MANHLSTRSKELIKLPHCSPGSKPVIIRRSQRLVLADKSPRRPATARLPLSLPRSREVLGWSNSLSFGNHLLPEDRNTLCQAPQSSPHRLRGASLPLSLHSAWMCLQSPLTSQCHRVLWAVPLDKVSPDRAQQRPGAGHPCTADARGHGEGILQTRSLWPRCGHWASG